MAEPYILKLEAISDTGQFICPSGSDVPYKLQKGFGEQYFKGNFISLLNYAVSPDIDEFNLEGLDNEEIQLADRIRSILDKPTDITLYIKRSDGDKKSVNINDKVGNYVENKESQLSDGPANYKGIDLILETTDGGG